jgi:hypothetical protein
MARLGSARFLQYESYVSDRSINMGDLAIAETVHALLLQALGYPVRVSRINWDEPLPADRIDLLLVAGGGCFFLNSQGRLPDHVASDFQTWQARQIPFAFVGVGINPLLKGEGSHAISVRDRTTCDALAALTTRPAARIGGPALRLAAMSANPEPLPRAARARLQVGVNDPLHGPDAPRRIRDAFPAHVDLLRRLQHRLGCDNHFMSHFECSTVPTTLFAKQRIRKSLLPLSVRLKSETLRSACLPALRAGPAP